MPSTVDLIAAMRLLVRARSYSATVVSVVALSLALAATVFAVADGVLFKPLPYADPQRLMRLDPWFERDPAFRSGRITAELLDRWQQAVPEIPIAAVRVDAASGLEGLNESGLGVAQTRGKLLEVLGVRPLLGGFSRDDFDPSTAKRPAVRPVLITYELWQQRFGGAVNIVGQGVAPVDPTEPQIRIAGVLPRGFVVPARRPAQLVRPPSFEYSGSLRETVLLARLPENISVDAFRSRLEAAMKREAESMADPARAARVPDRLNVVPLEQGLDAWSGSLLRAVFAAVVVLVLVACLNLSGLMTARCLDRGRDFGLRRAIGARTVDIVTLLLAEHVLLFVCGAAIGLAAAGPLIRLVATLLPPDLQLLKTPALDLRVASFTVLAMAASFAIASTWPIRRTMKLELQPLITAAGGGSVTPRTSGLSFRLITGGQVAATIVLVVAGGLLVASLLRVKANEIGYQTDHVIVAELAIAPWVDGNARNRRPDVKARLGAFVDELARVPGVAAVGAADVSVLIGSLTFTSRFDPVGRPARDPSGGFSVGASSGLMVPVTPGFFEAAGIRPIEGRLPTDQELRVGAPVVAISRTYARTHFREVSAVGQHLQHTPAEDLPVFEIVGVVEDPRLMTWDGPVSAAVFTSYATFGGDPDPVLFVQASRRVDEVMIEVIKRAESQRPVLRPVRVQTAAVMLDNTIRVRRLQSWLFGSFAAASLVLAGVGLLGLAAMTMARRTREIGIRVALGATRSRLVAGLVFEHSVPVSCGLAAGALLAAWAVRFVASYVYELSVYDARVWTAAMLVVIATAATGALIPSLRASRVDPLRALRVE